MNPVQNLRPLAPNKRRLFVAPSLACDLACNYCYAHADVHSHEEPLSGYGAEPSPLPANTLQQVGISGPSCSGSAPSVTPAAHAQGRMSLAEFEDLVTRMVSEDYDVELCFVGGEPSLWPHMDKALHLCRQHSRLSTVVFTNGARRLEPLPTSLYFSVNTLEFQGSAQSRARALDVLAAYNGAPDLELALRYVVTQSTDSRDIELVLELLNTFKNADIAIGFDFRFFLSSNAVSQKARESLGRNIHNMLDSFHAVRGTVEIQDPIPLCLFSDRELAELRKRFTIVGVCPSPHNSMVLLAGGFVQACPCIPIHEPMGKEESLFVPPASLARKCDELRERPPSSCVACEHFVAHECQGGCLSFRPN